MKNDILQTLIEMEKAGQLDCTYFDDIPFEIYHHRLCPGISSTRLKMVYKNDFTEIKDTVALEVGRAFHCYILEPEKFALDYSIGQIGLKNYLSYSDYEMFKSMRYALEAHPEYETLLNGGASERTYFSRDKVTGILKKCRTDKIKGIRISDLKTTQNASQSSFLYDAKKYLYGFSAVYYLEIVSEVLGQRTNDFNVWALEKKLENPKIGIYKPNDFSIDKWDLAIRESLETMQLEKELSVKTFIGHSPEIRSVYL